MTVKFLRIKSQKLAYHLEFFFYLTNINILIFYYKKVLLTFALIAGFAATANAQCAENETYVNWGCGEGCAWVMEGPLPLYLSTVNFEVSKRALTIEEKRDVESAMAQTCLGGGRNATLLPN